MEKNIEKFTETLIKSYNAFIEEYYDGKLNDSSSDKEDLTLDFLQSRWGDTDCKILGTTPKNAIGEFFPEEIDFDDIIYMYDSFAYDGVYDIPVAVCDLLFSAPEAAEEYILSIIDEMDLNINGDRIISDEDNKKLCLFIESIKISDRIAAEKVKDRLFRIFSECSAENYLINETVCDAMESCGFVKEMVGYIEKCSIIGEKEHYILQKLVKLSDTDDAIFKCLKSCLKKDCKNISMTVQIVSDCGDGRLIPLIRKIARNQLEAIFDAGKTPYDESQESQEFFLICNAVTRLGGSIEDLLTLE